MELLPDELRQRLPPLHSQDQAVEPMVWIHYQIGTTSIHWYVIEGQPEGDDFVFFGFVADRNPDFRMFRLSELKDRRGLFDERVVRDEDFVPGMLTDVVPAPDL